MRRFSKNITYSQNGEEGILVEVFKRLNVKKGTACEFGAHNGKFCSNTRYFLENGWSGTLIEADPDLFNEIDYPAKACAMVTPDNVNDLVPAKLDLLSIDCDGPDYSIWAAYSGRPKVVVVEVNSSFPPTSDMLMLAGTAYKPMVELGISKGYFLLIHTGNCIFIDALYRDKFAECIGDGLANADDYFDKSFL